MIETHIVILLIALIADWFTGEPQALWRRVGHPVAWIGWLIHRLDAMLNRHTDTAGQRYRNGAVAWTVLIAAALATAWVIGFVLRLLGPLGWLIEAAIVSVLLAQKSLKEHVAAVTAGLRNGGLEGGRRAVSLIVGRDPEQLDRAGVSRAAIESLAENFSDGVVAPAFWYAVFGLPGLIVYKAINTADSMIGHKSEKYLEFGRVAAQSDDLANWLPARLSALLIAAGAWALAGMAAARAALSVAARDAGLHRSPNAGWPEAAFAGALGIALGGPRIYANEAVRQSWLNASGRRDPDAGDIERALGLFALACFALWGAVLAVWIVV
ncbi:MAG: adenosylcobinamide-phosphate synthase CbiB [Salaquimonas sp.]|nr:adenosylcobinamide-phosphate synthase CbiB [Salaquimonas sp.]